MRPTHYLRKVLDTGDVQRMPFEAEHFREAGLMPAPFGGMPQLEAYQLINRWNVRQTAQRFVYGLE